MKYPDKGDFFSGSTAGVGVGFGGSVQVHGFSVVMVGLKEEVVGLAAVTGILSGTEFSSSHLARIGQSQI